MIFDDGIRDDIRNPNTSRNTKAIYPARNKSCTPNASPAAYIKRREQL